MPRRQSSLLVPGHCRWHVTHMCYRCEFTLHVCATAVVTFLQPRPELRACSSVRAPSVVVPRVLRSSLICLGGQIVHVYICIYIYTHTHIYMYIFIWCVCLFSICLSFFCVFSFFLNAADCMLSSCHVCPAFELCGVFRRVRILRVIKVA